MRQLKITKQITNRETQSIDKYLHEIGKMSMLTTSEEIELAIKIKNGDATALTALVKGNLRFVVSVAKQYQNQGLALPDLINEGNFGLIKAAKCFDETRGFKFISYAVWWIRQSILQALAENARLVRLPLNKVSSIHKINKIFAKLEQEFQREPTPEEIATILDITPKEVKETIKSSGRHLSMDAPLGNDEENSLYDIYISPEDHSTSPDSELNKESLKQEIERSLSTLNFREAQIIRMYYGLGDGPPCSLEEIGKTIGITSERVRQLKTKAIRTLKNTYRSKRLKSFL